jgi:Leucine-rich repeat (LRR) protein
LLEKYPKLCETVVEMNAVDAMISCADFSAFISKLAQLKILTLPKLVTKGERMALTFANPNVVELKMVCPIKVGDAFELPNFCAGYDLKNLKKYSYMNVAMLESHIASLALQVPLLEDLNLTTVQGFSRDLADEKTTKFIGFDDIAKKHLGSFNNLKRLNLAGAKTKGLCLLSLKDTIEEINISGTQVHPFVFAKLNKLPNLKIVNMTDCKLLDLDGKTEDTRVDKNFPFYNAVKALQARGVKMLVWGVWGESLIY